MRYMVFDVPTTEAVPFEERAYRLSELSVAKHIVPVDYKQAKNTSEMLENFRRVVASGGEGLVLRKPGHYYEFGRSSDWLKVKPSYID